MGGNEIFAKDLRPVALGLGGKEFSSLIDWRSRKKWFPSLFIFTKSPIIVSTNLGYSILKTFMDICSNIKTQKTVEIDWGNRVIICAS